jgi:uncharacterized protein YjbI with pentapeptide repeats
MTTTPPLEDDGITHTPANENPWYILMTLHGEYEDGMNQQQFIELNEKNQKTFFSWRHADSNTKTNILYNFNTILASRTSKIINIPDANSKVDLSKLIFTKPLYFDGFDFSAECDFSNSIFESKITLINCTFQNNFSFKKSKFQNTLYISSCEFICETTFFNASFKEPVTIDGTTFRNKFNASKTNFQNGLHLHNNSSFHGLVTFSETQIQSVFKILNTNFNQINLLKAILTKTYIESSSFKIAFFDNCTFQENLNIKQCKFTGACGFSNKTKFHGTVSLEYVTSTNFTDFTSAQFFKQSTFINCSFNNIARFDYCTFQKEVYFASKNNDITIFETIIFNNVTFHDIVDFSTAKFNVSARFYKTIFHKIAKFHRDLHENVSFQGADFSNIIANYTEEKDATEGLLYFQILKKYMENNKRHHDEMLFFKYEMQTIEYLNSLEKHGWIKNIPSKLYGYTSDYGRSIISPLAGLYIVFFLGAMDFKFLDDLDIATSIKLSIANTFFPFGLHKILFQHPPELTLIASDVVMFLQFIFGTVFLFLLGLGLRNRFKIK